MIQLIVLLIPFKYKSWQARPCRLRIHTADLQSLAEDKWMCGFPCTVFHHLCGQRATPVREHDRDSEGSGGGSESANGRASRSRLTYRGKGWGEIQGKNNRLDSCEAPEKRSQEPPTERYSLTSVSQQPRAQRINGTNDGGRRKKETQVGKEYEARSNGTEILQ